MADVLSRILAGVLGGGAGGGMGGSPLGDPRLPGDEAGRFGGRRGGVAPMSEQGGLGGILGGLLGGMGRGASPAGGPGDLRGAALMALLAYLMRGRGGTAGLSSLTDQLRGAGLEDRVDSWISTGPNHDIRPEELARAIPPEALDEVERQTGLGRDAVLSDLSRGLPGMVDRLTPRGRLPDRDDELDDHDENDVLASLGIGPVRRG